MMSNIILIGFKNSGKSTVGKALAQLLEREWIDTDLRIEALYEGIYDVPRNSRQISEIEGLATFRTLEESVTASLLWVKNAVISTGGGIVLSAQNNKLLRKMGTCIFLNTPLPLLKKRFEETASPIFQNSTIEALYEERLPLYQALAHLTLSIEESFNENDIAVFIHESIKKG